MLDPSDTSTIALPFDAPPRRPGRPSTGNAKTKAEVQRDYRQRQKLLREAGSVSVLLTPKDRFVIAESLRAFCTLDGNDYIRALLARIEPNHPPS